MQKAQLISTLTFGERVAEEEADVLTTYFVETDHWRRLYSDEVDIVYGAKGAGKSALYSLLMSNAPKLLDRKVLLIAAEHPRGATAFRDLAEDAPSSERELVGFWKLYILSLLHGALSELNVKTHTAIEVAKALEREGLIKGKASLSGLLRAVLNYARSALRPGALEGGVEIDPLTQLPRGFRGKITFSEPLKQNSGSELLSVNHLLQLANDALREAGFSAWIVHDRLDVAFADTPEVEVNALRALFRVYLDVKALDAIRLKIFLRSDVWARITSQGFREGSHVTRHLTITWNRNSLLNLIVRRLLHNENICSSYFVDQSLAHASTTAQETFLYRICPAQVDPGPSKPATFDWVLTRTRDGSKIAAPREVIHFFNSLRNVQAKKLEIGEADPPSELLFQRTSFKEALPEVSRVRLEQTLYAEYPAHRAFLEKLRGGKTQHTPATLSPIWGVALDEATLRANDLATIGFFETRGTRQSPEYWVPFLYRDALDMTQGAAGGADDLSARLSRYLTPTAPLGPSDAAQVADLEVAARLFDPHNKSFGGLLRGSLSVVLGRRGSGKTALLNSYRYKPFLETRESVSLWSEDFDLHAYDTVIEIASYKQFDEMQQIAVKDPSVFRPVEAVVADWARLVMDYVFATLICEEESGVTLASPLQLVLDYLSQEEEGFGQQESRRIVWGSRLCGEISTRIAHSSVSTRSYPISLQDAADALVEYLTTRGRQVVVIFDSLDEYDVSNPGLTRSIGALIRFISIFNSTQDRIRIKLSLPAEIFPEIQRASANPLKDFSRVDQLRWTSMELVQLAARRYRFFLELHSPATLLDLDHLDLNRRADVAEFWSYFFKQQQRNEYNAAEEPLTYIVRHTHLLPRQILMLLQRIIVSSASLTGGYQELKSEAVTSAVDMLAPLMATEIVNAFSHVYPDADILCRAIFDQLPTVFSFDELENRWRKRGRPIARRLLTAYDLSVPELAEMLTRMGILGTVLDESGKYYEAQFGYDTQTLRVSGNSYDRLCLHPIFGMYYRAAWNTSRKPVLPTGTIIHWQ
jgi:GTPase SAR1 family protein